MKKEKIENIRQKIISAFILIVYFGSTFGQAVVAQVNLGLGSKLQRKFSNEQDMLNYLTKLSPEDKFEFLNSSTTVCAQSGEKIFSSENKTTYKFLCFANNNQGINLQLTLKILNVGKNDFDFLGYSASDENAIRFDGYGSLKFTIFNQSRVVFSYLISSKNIPGIDADTNQGKVVIVNDNNDFSTFLTTLHETESILFLKNAYENIFNTTSAASYSATNIQTSDSSVQTILSSLTSTDVFNILGGQTVEKSLELATYGLSYDTVNNQIVVKSGNQTVGTADPQMSFVPVSIPSVTFSGTNNHSIAQLVANSTVSSLTGKFPLVDFANWFDNLFGRSVKAADSTSAQPNYLELLLQAAQEDLGPNNVLIVPVNEITYRNINNAEDIEAYLIIDYNSLSPDLRKLSDSQLRKLVFDRFEEIGSPYGFDIAYHGGTAGISDIQMTLPNGRIIQSVSLLRFENLESVTEYGELPSLYAGIYGTDAAKIKFINQISSSVLKISGDASTDYNFGRDYFVENVLAHYKQIFAIAELESSGDFYLGVISINGVNTVKFSGPYRFYLQLAYLSKLAGEPESQQQFFLNKYQEWKNTIEQRIYEMNPDLDAWLKTQQTAEKTIDSRVIMAGQLKEEFGQQMSSEWNQYREKYFDFDKARQAIQQDVVEEKVGTVTSFSLKQFTINDYAVQNDQSSTTLSSVEFASGDDLLTGAANPGDVVGVDVGTDSSGVVRFVPGKIVSYDVKNEKITVDYLDKTESLSFSQISNDPKGDIAVSSGSELASGTEETINVEKLKKALPEIEEILKKNGYDDLESTQYEEEIILTVTGIKQVSVQNIADLSMFKEIQEILNKYGIDLKIIEIPKAELTNALQKNRNSFMSENLRIVYSLNEEYANEFVKAALGLDVTKMGELLGYGEDAGVTTSTELHLFELMSDTLNKINRIPIEYYLITWTTNGIYSENRIELLQRREKTIYEVSPDVLSRYLELSFNQCYDAILPSKEEYIDVLSNLPELSESPYYTEKVSNIESVTKTLPTSSTESVNIYELLLKATQDELGTDNVVLNIYGSYSFMWSKDNPFPYKRGDYLDFEFLYDKDTSWFTKFASKYLNRDTEKDAMQRIMDRFVQYAAQYHVLAYVAEPLTEYEAKNLETGTLTKRWESGTRSEPKLIILFPDGSITVTNLYKKLLPVDLFTESETKYAKFPTIVFGSNQAKLKLAKTLSDKKIDLDYIVKDLMEYYKKMLAQVDVAISLDQSPVVHCEGGVCSSKSIASLITQQFYRSLATMAAIRGENRETIESFQKLYDDPAGINRKNFWDHLKNAYGNLDKTRELIQANIEEVPIDGQKLYLFKNNQGEIQDFEFSLPKGYEDINHMQYRLGVISTLLNNPSLVQNPEKVHYWGDGYYYASDYGIKGTKEEIDLLANLKTDKEFNLAANAFLKGERKASELYKAGKGLGGLPATGTQLSSEANYVSQKELLSGTAKNGDIVGVNLGDTSVPGKIVSYDVQNQRVTVNYNGKTEILDFEQILDKPIGVSGESGLTTGTQASYSEISAASDKIKQIGDLVRNGNINEAKSLASENGISGTDDEIKLLGQLQNQEITLAAQEFAGGTWSAADLYYAGKSMGGLPAKSGTNYQDGVDTLKAIRQYFDENGEDVKTFSKKMMPLVDDLTQNQKDFTDRFLPVGGNQDLRQIFRDLETSLNANHGGALEQRIQRYVRQLDQYLTPERIKIIQKQIDVISTIKTIPDATTFAEAKNVFKKIWGVTPTDSAIQQIRLILSKPADNEIIASRLIKRMPNLASSDTVIIAKEVYLEMLQNHNEIYFPKGGGGLAAIPNPFEESPSGTTSGNQLATGTQASGTEMVTSSTEASSESIKNILFEGSEMRTLQFKESNVASSRILSASSRMSYGAKSVASAFEVVFKEFQIKISPKSLAVYSEEGYNALLSEALSWSDSPTVEKGGVLFSDPETGNVIFIRSRTIVNLPTGTNEVTLSEMVGRELGLTDIMDIHYHPITPEATSQFGLTEALDYYSHPSPMDVYWSFVRQQLPRKTLAIANTNPESGNTIITFWGIEESALAPNAAKPLSTAALFSNQNTIESLIKTGLLQKIAVVEVNPEGNILGNEIDVNDASQKMFSQAETAAPITEETISKIISQSSETGAPSSIKTFVDGSVVTDYIAQSGSIQKMVSYGDPTDATVFVSETTLSTEDGIKEILARQTALQTSTTTQIQGTKELITITEQTGDVTSIKISVDATMSDALAKNGGQIETTVGDAKIKITVDANNPSAAEIDVNYKGTDLPAQNIDLTKSNTFSVDATNGGEPSIRSTTLSSTEQSLADQAQVATTSGETISTNINSDGTATVTAKGVTMEGTSDVATLEVNPDATGQGFSGSVEVNGQQATFTGIARTISNPAGEVNGILSDTIAMNGKRIIIYTDNGIETFYFKGNTVEYGGTAFNTGEVGGPTGGKTLTVDEFEQALEEGKFRFSNSETIDVSDITNGRTRAQVIMKDGEINMDNVNAMMGSGEVPSETLAGDAETANLLGRAVGIGMDALMIFSFGYQVAAITTGNMPLGISTPQQFQSTVTFGATTVFAAVGVADIFATLGGVAELGAVAGALGGPVGIGIMVGSFAVIEAAPYAFANNQLGGNLFVSPTGENLFSQIFTSLASTFSGQESLLQNNPVFSQIYAEDFVKTAQAAGGIITYNNGVPTVTKNSVDITASVSTTAYGSARSTFLYTPTAITRTPIRGGASYSVQVNTLMTEMESTTNQNLINTDAAAIAAALHTTPQFVLAGSADHLQTKIDNVQNQIDAANSQPAMIMMGKGIVPNPARAQIPSLEQEKTNLLGSQGATLSQLFHYGPTASIGNIDFTIDTEHNTITTFDLPGGTTAQVTLPFDSQSNVYVDTTGTVGAQLYGVPIPGGLYQIHGGVVTSGPGTNVGPGTVAPPEGTVVFAGTRTVNPDGSYTDSVSQGSTGYAGTSSYENTLYGANGVPIESTLVTNGPDTNGDGTPDSSIQSFFGANKQFLGSQTTSTDSSGTTTVKSYQAVYDAAGNFVSSNLVATKTTSTDAGGTTTVTLLDSTGHVVAQTVNNLLTQISIPIGDQTYSVHLTTLPSSQQSSLLNPTSIGSFTMQITIGEGANAKTVSAPAVVTVDNFGIVQSLTYHVQISPTLTADVVVNTQTHITTTTYSDGTLVTEQTNPTTGVVTTTTSRPDGTVQTQQTTPTTGATTDTLMKNGKLVSQTTTFANSVQVTKSQDPSNLSGYSTSVKLPGTFGTTISVSDPSQVTPNPGGSVTVQHQSYGIDPTTGKSGYYENDLTITSGTYSGVSTTKVVIVENAVPDAYGYVGTVYVSGSPILVTQQGLDYWKSHTQTTTTPSATATRTATATTPYCTGLTCGGGLATQTATQGTTGAYTSAPTAATTRAPTAATTRAPTAATRAPTAATRAPTAATRAPTAATRAPTGSSPMISLLKSSSPLITMIKSATATSQILDFLNNLFQQFLQLFSNQQNKEATTGSVLEIPENLTETTSIENILTTPITIPTISIPSVSQNFTNNLP